MLFCCNNLQYCSLKELLSDIKLIVHLSIFQRTRLILKSQLVSQLLDQPQFNPLCTQVLYQRSSINLMPLIRRQQLPRSWSNNVLVSKVKSLGFNWLVLAHSTRWPDLCDSSAARFEKYKHKIQYLHF